MDWVAEIAGWRIPRCKISAAGEYSHQEENMLVRNALIVCAVLARVAGAAEDGPTMVMKAAEQVAYADSLIQSCRYDEAERWIGRALHSARDTRSDSSLVRDMAGTFVGSLEIKTLEFREQRKNWDRALQQARRQFDANRLESARRLLREASAPACDPRFRELSDQIEGRAARVAALVRQGDGELSRHSADSALKAYLQVQALDVEIPGLAERITEARARIPHRCVACAVGKVVLFTAVLGGVGYGGYYGYQRYERQQQAGAVSKVGR
jgi:hypothetical protein